MCLSVCRVVLRVVMVPKQKKFLAKSEEGQLLSNLYLYFMHKKCQYLFYFFDDNKYLLTGIFAMRRPRRNVGPIEEELLIYIPTQLSLIIQMRSDWKAYWFNFIIVVKKLFSYLLLEHHAKAGVFIKILLNYGSFKQYCSFKQYYFYSYTNLCAAKWT